MASTSRGRPMAVKNKAAAPVQITAEQILREAMDRREVVIRAPEQKITDVDELQHYRARKRKEYEDTLRRQQHNVGVWMKYALWEASQLEFERARSIFERALDVDYRNHSVWLKYAEMEMKNRFVNHARNIWDRAVTLLPRVDQFWFKYTHMEEMLGNVAGARVIFERWMKWAPPANAWQSYVMMEMRHGKDAKMKERCRAIYERFIVCHPTVDSYMKYAKFEKNHGDPDKCREVFERCSSELGDDTLEEDFFMHFASFEAECQETERARAIYKYALERLPKAKSHEIYRRYTNFEKQFGTREGIEDVIISKRRQQYEREVAANPHNYDIWFDYIKLEQSCGNNDRIRDVFERAVANVPLVHEKHYWARYIYLWIQYVIFEELTTEDVERTRLVYKAALKVIPHKLFTFAKIWIMFAEFEIRQMDLKAARRILGRAIGMAPKEKLFKSYIQLELQLGDADRCRTLYEKYLIYSPENCHAWSKFANLEKSLAENERARAIFELAISQPVLDMPEVLWKAYIDFETQQDQFDRARSLYDRLLEKTKHVKVWISLAQFETSQNQLDKARHVFERADKYLKAESRRSERAQLLEAWRDFERKYGNEATQTVVSDRMPRRLKKRRLLTNEDGTDAGWEEYYDYEFPDDAKGAANIALLEKARLWKKQRLEATEDDA
ncbi:hypothetical protein PBRA_007198 [Plasmodiophora brassicae]|nr:hypothetical protein PBRA_007198 [Plasmodiophora brassicae]